MRPALCYTLEKKSFPPLYLWRLFLELTLCCHWSGKIHEADCWESPSGRGKRLPGLCGHKGSDLPERDKRVCGPCIYRLVSILGFVPKSPGPSCFSQGAWLWQLSLRNLWSWIAPFLSYSQGSNQGPLSYPAHAVFFTWNAFPTCLYLSKFF